MPQFADGSKSKDNAWEDQADSGQGPKPTVKVMSHFGVVPEEGKDYGPCDPNLDKNPEGCRCGTSGVFKPMKAKDIANVYENSECLCDEQMGFGPSKQNLRCTIGDFNGQNGLERLFKGNCANCDSAALRCINNDHFAVVCDNDNVFVEFFASDLGIGILATTGILFILSCYFFVQCFKRYAIPKITGKKKGRNVGKDDLLDATIVGSRNPKEMLKNNPHIYNGKSAVPRERHAGEVLQEKIKNKTKKVKNEDLNDRLKNLEKMLQNLPASAGGTGPEIAAPAASSFTAQQQHHQLMRGHPGAPPNGRGLPAVPAFPMMPGAQRPAPKAVHSTVPPLYPSGPHAPPGPPPQYLQ